MLAYSDRVLRAAGNQALNEAFRYLPQRWAELLDEHSHFSRAAVLALDPLTAARDLAEAGLQFLSDEEFRYPTMLEAFRTMKQALKLEHRCASWFAGERAALVTILNGIEPVQGDTRDKKRAYLLGQTRRVIYRTGPLPPFLAALRHPTTGYRARLVESICGAAADPPTSDEDWQLFDADLLYLAATMLHEQRGIRHLVDSVAEAFADADSDAAAADEFSRIVTAVEGRHTVIAVLRGARSTVDLSALGCHQLDLRAAEWPVPQGSRARRRLRSFIKKNAGRSGCALCIPVDAYDAEHARAKALTIAETVHDQFAAEHRISEFSLHKNVLVMRDADGKIVAAGAPRRSAVEQARLLTGPNYAGLERSLRYHRLARTEEESVLAVALSWIALEHLAEGAEKTVMADGIPTVERNKPADFLPDHVAALGFLAVGRHVLLGPWKTTQRACRQDAVVIDAWRQVERWLGVPRNHWRVNPDRWLELLKEDPGTRPAPIDLQAGAPVADAAAFLRDISDLLPPFAARRLREGMAAARNSASLVSICARAQLRAKTAVSRTHLMRHEAVHGALIDKDSARHLARVALHLLDAVYEVLPYWLAVGDPVWQGFDRARKWRTALMQQLNAPQPLTTGPVRIVQGP